MNEKLTLRGVIPPMVTPLTASGELDVAGTERLVEHILSGGVHGLFLLGTTGEAPDLPYEVRRELVRRVTAQVNGRVPILVGITDTVFSESLKLAEFAKACGADALVAAPPYYFAAGQPELIAYYTQLADQVPLPLYLYNMPSKVKVFINFPTVVELSKHPNIAGVKDSSGNAGYMASLIHEFRDTDFDVFIGPEEVTGIHVLIGANGGVNGGANMYPKLFVNMYKAAASGDVAKVNELQKKIML